MPSMNPMGSGRLAYLAGYEAAKAGVVRSKNPGVYMRRGNPYEAWWDVGWSDASQGKQQRTWGTARTA